MLACAPGPSPAPPAEDLSRPLPSPLPAVAARVNGRPILTLTAAAAARQNMLAGKIGEDQKPLALRQATAQLVERELLLQEALARGFVAAEDAVRAAYDQARVDHPEEAAWVKHLAEQGFEPASFVGELRAQHTIAAMLAAETRRLDSLLAEADVRAYYDAHPEAFRQPEVRHASQILFPWPEGAERAAVRRGAEEVRRRALRGEDFAALARRHSGDPATAPSGGRMAPLSPGQRLDMIEATLRRMEPGRVSDLVETGAGLHLLRLDRVEPAFVRPFGQVREQARELLLRERREAWTKAAVAALKARARVELTF
jgi:parvulin-like peptidyl-prolyl isomerase